MKVDTAAPDREGGLSGSRQCDDLRAQLAGGVRSGYMLTPGIISAAGQKVNQAAASRVTICARSKRGLEQPLTQSRKESAHTHTHTHTHLEGGSACFLTPLQSNVADLRVCACTSDRTV
eukprot:114417-Pelagomonas_calceolata.AAC.1